MGWGTIAGRSCWAAAWARYRRFRDGLDQRDQRDGVHCSTLERKSAGNVSTARVPLAKRSGLSIHDIERVQRENLERFRREREVRVVAHGPAPRLPWTNLRYSPLLPKTLPIWPITRT